MTKVSPRGAYTQPPHALSTAFHHGIQFNISSVNCCYSAFNTAMGSNGRIGTLHGNKCYVDSVTIPVVHTMSMAHGSWIRARMTENDPIALILRRKGRELNMPTYH